MDRILAGARSGTPLRVVDDQEISTTYAPDLAEAIVALVGGRRARRLPRGERGLVHLARAGGGGAAQAGRPRAWPAVTSEELGAPAPRPRYSVLSTERYRSRGLPPLRDWRAALADHLANV